MSKPDSSPDGSRSRRAFVAAAIALGAAAPLAGSPYARLRGSVDVAELARLVRTRDDHVSAIELARWIRARRPGLRVIDLRPAEDFGIVSIPTAENASIEALLEMPFRDDETVVLYSEGGAHAAQGWVFLQSLGHRKSYFLASGIHEWVAEVLEPGLASDATDRERAEFVEVSELSRYFGGMPRVDVPRSQLRARAVELKRRGC